MVYTSEKCICMLDANVANTHVSRVTGPVLVVRVISKHGSTPRVGPSKRRYINSGRVRDFTLLISRFFQHFCCDHAMAILKALPIPRLFQRSASVASSSLAHWGDRDETDLLLTHVVQADPAAV